MNAAVIYTSREQIEVHRFTPAATIGNVNVAVTIANANLSL